MRRHIGTLLLAAALAAPAAPAAALPAPLPRLEASDAVSAAVAWSRHGVADGGADTALLARDDDFADALASGTAQRIAGAPLLLTPTGSLDPRTAEELDRIGATTVVVLGGRAAVADAVLDDLRGRGYAVERVAGADRISTAVAVARRFPEPDDGRPDFVLVRAFGTPDDPTRAWADSLAAGTKASVLLTETDRLSPATAAFLDEQTGSDRSVYVTVAGGPAAIDDAVLDDLRALRITTARRGGPTRAITAARVQEPGPSTPRGYLIVDGQSPAGWAAGLSATRTAVSTDSNVLLANGSHLPTVTAGALLDHAPLGATVCGPLLPEDACHVAEIALNAQTTGRRGTLMEFLGVPGASAFAELYPSSYEDALCYRVRPFNLASVDSVTLHLGSDPNDSTSVLDLGTDTARAFEIEIPEVIGCSPHGQDELFTSPQPSSVQVVAEGDMVLVGRLFAPTRTFEVPGTASAVVPVEGPQDAQLDGIVALSDDPSEICFAATLRNVPDDPTAARVRRGASGETGEVIVDLVTPRRGGGAGCRAADADALAQIPDSGAYVEIVTAANPQGAVRGPLLRHGA